jgi:hypothetical protein
MITELDVNDINLACGTQIRAAAMITETVGCMHQYVSKIRNQAATSCNLTKENPPASQNVVGKDSKPYSVHCTKPVSAKFKNPKILPPPSIFAVSFPADKHKLSVEELFSETQLPEKTTNVSVGKQQTAWKQRETDIFATIAELLEAINEWFDVAPPEYHDSFAERVRQRLNEILGNES